MIKKSFIFVCLNMVERDFHHLLEFFFQQIHKIEAQLLFYVNNKKNIQPIINMQCEEKQDFIWKSNTIEWEVVYTKERSFAN